MEGGEGAEGSSTCGRNWEDLSRDVLILIFLKLGMMQVLTAAGSVCRSWRKVAKEEPVFWRRINMIDNRYFGFGNWYGSKLIHATRIAIDRSGGQLEEFAVKYFADDEMLRYLCDRTSVLKKLVLVSCAQLSAEAIAQTAKRQPLLEEIEIEFGPFSEQLTEIVGTACPCLKSFKLNHTRYNMPPLDPDIEEEITSNDDEALGIAKTMHQLRHLELIGNRLTNEGLTAILDGCPHLETLDATKCYYVTTDADMYARCARLQSVSFICLSDYGLNSHCDDDEYIDELDPAYHNYDHINEVDPAYDNDDHINELDPQTINQGFLDFVSGLKNLFIKTVFTAKRWCTSQESKGPF
ncbi:RNI-like superfamily protein [Rhynchospora pubera]|uniref:RNI-like superfamily protein n=1 Tax=Rhynchospora pubera TaxID=906938 RepID=A0AAV8F3H8_9POAL|nr:RNI-like superfamily protein [Rhynchospora pubera]